MSSTNFQNDTLFVTMQYLRTVNKVRKYHWGLFSTGPEAPRGDLLHATDNGRQALDLRLEARAVEDPRSSKSMVVCLGIGHSPGFDILKACADSIPLMDNRRLPRGEPQWTCRVWVKNMLFDLHRHKYIKLLYDIGEDAMFLVFGFHSCLIQGYKDTIERLCQRAADLHIMYIGKARIFNNTKWMNLKDPTSPMDTRPDEPEVQARYYGPKPMILDSTTPTGTSHKYSQPTGRYYGTKPMNIDWTGGY